MSVLGTARRDDVATPPATEPRATRRVWDRRLPTVAALVVILVVGAYSLGVTWATHASVPQNDDWSFIRSALLLHRTGEIRLQGWGQMFLIGQLASAQPFLAVFGARVAGLKLYGVVMTAVWLWCSFVLARRCVGPRRAVLLVGTLALWPGLALLASSFMTDLPACAMSLLTILVGVRAVERQSRGWLLLALLIGVFAFTIREQAVAGVGAVLVGALLSGRSSRRFRTEALVATVLTALLCALLEHARQQLGHADPAPFGLQTLNLTRLPLSLSRVPFTLGLDLSPLVLWAVLSFRGRHDWLDRGRVSGWVVGVAALASIAVRDLSAMPQVLLPNYVTSSGGFAVATVGYAAPAVSETHLWNIAQVVAMVCGVLLLGEVGARLALLRRRVPDGRRSGRLDGPAATMLASYTALLALTTIALSLAGQTQVDRYQVGLLPGLGVLLLGLPARSHRGDGSLEQHRRGTQDGRGTLPRPVVGAVAAGLVGLLAALSAVTTVRTDRRDHAVWDAALRLTRHGVPATHINAGLDWNGFHATVPLDRLGPDYDAYRGQHWMYLFPESTDCYVVAVTEIDRPFLVPQPRSAGQAYVYRNKRCRPVPEIPGPGS